MRHFGLFYDTWRHIWRHNIVLRLWKFKMSKFWHQNRFFIPKKLNAFWDQHSHFIEISGVLGDFGTILGPFEGPWHHKMGQDFEIWIFDFIIGFQSPERLPMLNFRSKKSFYRVFWHFWWFSDNFGSFWGSVTSQKRPRF